MKASKRVGVAFSLLLASATAGQSFVNSVDFKGRNLHKDDSWHNNGDRTTLMGGDSKGVIFPNEYTCASGASAAPSGATGGADASGGGAPAGIIKPTEASWWCPELASKGKEALYPKYTARFANGPDTYDNDGEPRETAMLGLIIGGVCTLVFILFALVNIIIDESERHAKFSMDVQNAKSILMRDPPTKEGDEPGYGVT